MWSCIRFCAIGQTKQKESYEKRSLERVLRSFVDQWHWIIQRLEYTQSEAKNNYFKRFSFILFPCGRFSITWLEFWEDSLITAFCSPLAFSGGPMTSSFRRGKVKVQTLVSICIFCIYPFLVAVISVRAFKRTCICKKLVSAPNKVVQESVLKSNKAVNAFKVKLNNIRFEMITFNCGIENVSSS